MTSVQELSTPRARLREVRLEDAEALLDIYGHPEGVRYLGRPPQTLEQVQTRLQRMREDVERGEAAFWVMTDPGADRAVAYLGFFRWDVTAPDRRAGLRARARALGPGADARGPSRPGAARLRGAGRCTGWRRGSTRGTSRPSGWSSAWASGRRERLRDRTLNADGSREDLLLFGLLRPEFRG